MKKLNVSTFALFLILICNNFFAQNHLPHFDNIEDNEAKLFNELNLSPEQEAQVKAIQEKYLPQLKEIHNDARETHFKNIDKIREIRQSQKAELEKVLTGAQVNLLKEKRQQHFQYQKPYFEGQRLEGKKRQTIRKEIHSYVLENVLPVLKTQRVKLDQFISSSDKAKIEVLRTTFEIMKSQMKATRKELRNQDFPTEQIEQLRAIREQNQPNIEEVKVLAEKYGSEIKILKAEIEANILQWKTEVKAIVDKHLEGGDVPRGRFHHLRHHFMHGIISKVRFLLLDPNMDYTIETFEEGEEAFEEKQISVFPNPTTQTNTIEFEVKKAGNIRIDLMGRNGAFIRTILDEYKSIGTHQVKVNIDDLTDHLYFYVVSDESGQTTKEFLISK